jgi:hypothetical protein
MNNMKTMLQGENFSGSEEFICSPWKITVTLGIYIFNVVSAIIAFRNNFDHLMLTSLCVILLSANTVLVLKANFSDPERFVVHKSGRWWSLYSMAVSLICTFAMFAATSNPFVLWASFFHCADAVSAGAHNYGVSADVTHASLILLVSLTISLVKHQTY